MRPADISPARTSTRTAIALRQLTLALAAVAELDAAELEDVDYAVDGESLDAPGYLRHLQRKLDDLVERQQWHRWGKARRVVRPPNTEPAG